MGRIKDYYQSTIPTTLRLPDGREFDVNQLMKLANKNKINLKRNGSPVKKCSPPRAARYSNKETEWIIKSSIKDIMMRYGCTVHKAEYIKNMVITREGLDQK